MSSLEPLTAIPSPGHTGQLGTADIAGASSASTDPAAITQPNTENHQSVLHFVAMRPILSYHSELFSQKVASDRQRPLDCCDTSQLWTGAERLVGSGQETKGLEDPAER